MTTSDYTGINAISDDGTRATGSAGPGAILWTQANGLQTLRSLSGSRVPWGGYGISADGQVIVGELDRPIGYEAFKWSATTGTVPLGTLPSDPNQGVGTGASRDGSVLVGFTGGGSAHAEAFRWTEATGLQSLGDVPGGFARSHAMDVSRDGNTVVGAATPEGNTTSAARWTMDLGWELLDVPWYAESSMAEAVSDDGDTIVGYLNFPSGYSGFRWKEGEGILALPGFAGGAEQSMAHDITSDGFTVVGSVFGASFSGPFIWNPDIGMQLLWNVLLGQGIDPALDGWSSLGSANTISGDGRFIGGSGWRNGVAEGWIAEITPFPGAPVPSGSAVPEASTRLVAVGMLGLAAFEFLARRNRRESPRA